MLRAKFAFQFISSTMLKRVHQSATASRTSPPRSVKSRKEETSVDPRRHRVLRGGQHPDSNKPVLYWVSRDLRVADNWALLYAIEEAKRTTSPVAVICNIVDEYLGAGARQYGFLLRGLRHIEPKLNHLGIPFFLTTGKAEENISKLVKQVDARLLVSDFSPLRLQKEWKSLVCQRIECSFVEVDAHNIVPVWIASPKREHAAYTLRPKIKALLPEFLTEFPELSTCGIPDWPTKLLPDPIDWDGVLAAALERGKHIPEVEWLTPGEDSGREAMENFLQKDRLALYATQRNDPNTPQAQSNLSPYFHFGFLAPQRAALEAKKLEKKFKEPVEEFLEQLIIRRELSDNFCNYEPNYDRMDAAADWAKTTLQLHSTDPRQYLYTKEQLEQAKTHDELWNACQKELVHYGKLHGYMRMYWAKKMLEWTKAPEEALAFAIEFNDKYLLDGRDPNGYVGCQWSITGVHDHGFREQAVSGKIRMMTFSGCKRKFNISDYINRVNQIQKAAQNH